MTIRSLFVVLALALSAAPLFAQEEIRQFDTVFEVHTDASVTITETITVNAERDTIRRGIFRDIPTRLEGPDGRLIRQSLAVISVTRNGVDEPFAIEGISGGERIRIGSSSVMLPVGEHTYEIVYGMDRAARMFAGYDEFYWNATGNYWEYPIQRAQVTVLLPDGARIIETNAYTGAYGVRSSDNFAMRVDDRTARFGVTRTLREGEGLTISVTFEKGILIGPQGAEAALAWLSDYRDFLVPIVLLIMVIGYNGLAWSAVGRDPAKGVIFPRFHAPKGFSPALTHYVHTMGWGRSGWTAFSAALISLATKGLIEITTEGKTTTLTVTGKAPEPKLPPGEAVIFGELQALSPVTIDQSSGPSLDKARSRFMAAIEKENRTVYFNNNFAYSAIGVVIGIASLGAMVFLGILHPALLAVAVIAAIVLSILTSFARKLWQGRGIGRFIGFGVVGIFAANASIAAADFASDLAFDFPMVAAITIVSVTLMFAVLMRAPTVHGRKVMDDIDGFKLYLDTAEKERLNFQGEPEMSVSRFEAILPFAMALGVEKPWSERFENDLARHAIRDGGESYSPRWYRGADFSSGAFARTMGGVATGLSAAMISSQPQASTSSGSGGGGFSGGGGGGGGGGGW